MPAGGVRRYERLAIVCVLVCVGCETSLLFVKVLGADGCRCEESSQEGLLQ
jgi:hypothetical protein